MEAGAGLKSVFDGFAAGLQSPFIVVDSSGNLIAYNKPATDLFGIGAGAISFADLFLISESRKIKTLLTSSESKEYGESISLFLRNGKEISVSYKFRTVEYQEERFRLLHFSESEQNDSGSLKLSFSGQERDKLNLSSGLLDLIGDIESSYPFTYLTKTRLQASANSLTEMIWLKDPEGKYVLVNDKYASLFNLKTSQLEGRTEKQFVPPHVDLFYSSLEEYLKEVGSIVKIVTKNVKGVVLAEPFEILEIPFLDLENKLVALLGIAKKYETESISGNIKSDNSLIFDDSNIFNLENVLKLKNKMYEFLVSKNPDAVFIYDLESFKFLDVNAAALSLYGYSRDEFLQMDLTDLYLFDDIQSIAGSAKNEEEKFDGPYKHRKKDGSLIQVEIFKVAFTYEGANAYFNIVRDITGLLEKEERLQMMRTAFEHSQDILIITDSTGFITEVNPATEKYLGFTHSELINNSIVSFAPEEARSNFLKKSFTPFSFTTKIKKKGGSLLDVEFTSTAFQGVDGEINRMSFIGKVAAPAPAPKEVVVEKEVEKVVYVDKPVEVEKIVYVEKDKSGEHEIKAGGIEASQLSFIFHEILTPINVIVGFIAELKDSLEEPTSEQQEAIEFIDENRKKLLYTMDSISEYAQIEEHFNELNKTEFSLGELFNRVMKDFAESNNPWKKPIEIEKVTADLQISSDRDKIADLIELILKVICHVSVEKQIIMSGYQIDGSNFIVTFRDHHVMIQQQLLYNIQNLFIDLDVSKLRGFGVSRFTLFSAQRLFDLLGGKFEIIKKTNTPHEIGLILPINAVFKTTESTAEEGKEKLFKPALVADARSIDSVGDQSSRTAPVAPRPAAPAATKMPSAPSPAQVTPSASYASELGPTPPRGEYEDFDFDRELEFLKTRGTRETSSFDRTSESVTPQMEDPFRNTGYRRDTFEKDMSLDSESFRRTFENVPQDKPTRPQTTQPTYPTTERYQETTPQRPVTQSDPATTRRYSKGTLVTEPAQQPAEAPAGVDLTKLTCLYIEDQLDSQILFKVQMKELKNIKFSQSFEDAIPMLESEKFDFIVLDINLQGEYNGLDALKIIRTMDGLENTPVIAVTAYVLPGDKEKFIATGFNDFVSKPIFRSKIVEVLSKIF